MNGIIANKTQYKRANERFENLIQSIIFEIGKTDNSILHNIPKDLTFKLVRDTRYSADKSPYNPTFRAHISSKGKLPIPVGYFIVIKPNRRSFLGGGLFIDMFKDATTMIRDYIVENSKKYMHINCFWVSGQYKGQGYANDLLNYCIDDAKAKGEIGLTIIASEKKRGYLPDPDYMKYKGFKVADKASLFFLYFTTLTNAPY